MLGIETSCDETALSIIEVKKTSEAGGAEAGGAELTKPSFRVISNVLISQIAIHENYGGVFPMLAKREHAKNLVPLLHKALLEARMLKEKSAENENEVKKISPKTSGKIQALLAKEAELGDRLIEFLEKYEVPAIDAIAVTSGPGLEPALWVGISFAKALGLAWNIPIVPVNHMEGHIISALLPESLECSAQSLKPLTFPALALLISGGHTELVLMRSWRQYELLGQTRDDAVGEAFDKVARLLGLSYPGGPHISKLAEAERLENQKPEMQRKPSRNLEMTFDLPRPMIDSGDFDFSFSGLKTAVLYALKGQNGSNATNPSASAAGINEAAKQQMACEFENAVTETLIAKTESAIEHVDAQTLIIGGGVIANMHIRQGFEEMARQHDISLLLPQPALTTDNALMIALAGYFVHTQGHVALFETDFDGLVAKGNLSFGI